MLIINMIKLLGFGLILYRLLLCLDGLELYSGLVRGLGGCQLLSGQRGR
jgi:hypothetical protein